MLILLWQEGILIITFNFFRLFYVLKIMTLLVRNSQRSHLCLVTTFMLTFYVDNKVVTVQFIKWQSIKESIQGRTLTPLLAVLPEWITIVWINWLCRGSLFPCLKKVIPSDLGDQWHDTVSRSKQRYLLSQLPVLMYIDSMIPDSLTELDKKLKLFPASSRGSE